LENRLLVLLTQGFEMHFESVKSDVGYPLFQYFITVFWVGRVVKSAEWWCRECC
jgi:hypothetical protein